MIDIENYVINAVQNAVEASYPTATVYGEYVPAPAEFPCVSIVEDDNYTYTRANDDQLTEHAANVAYTINIFTDNQDGKKALAKGIAKIVDDTMQGMKFTRTFKGQVPNIDRTIYRITLRYRAVVGEPITVNGVITYPMYRQ